MTNTETAAATTPTTPVQTGVTGRPTLSPYLAVSDARRAVEWYVRVFSGVLGETVEMPDGRLGHAEIRIGNATLMLADEFPEIGHASPVTRGGTTVTVVIDVADVDARSPAPRRARGQRSSGSRPTSPTGSGARPSSTPSGTAGSSRPRCPPRPPSPPPPAAPPAAGPGVPDEPVHRPGDIVYVTWRVKDEQRTAAFFGELLGWTLHARHVEHGTPGRTAPTCSAACGAEGDARPERRQADVRGRRHRRGRGHGPQRSAAPPPSRSCSPTAGRRSAPTTRAWSSGSTAPAEG